MKKFSIIIPVYNAEKTIARTLASLISNKDFIHEVIIVNDRSTDNTLKEVEKFKSFLNIKVIDNKGNQGPGPGRKTGILEATGEWITFLDADDCLTSSSLYYVDYVLNQETKIVLLHCQSLYYESGNFQADRIGHSDFSCGGNFYKRQYLIENNLFPHDTLYMAEDEYFNSIVITYIEKCSREGRHILIKYFNYPVYEVHHDTSEGLSFALRNWVDYLSKYHFLYRIYIIDFFKDYPRVQMELKNSFLETIFLGYFLTQGVLKDSTIVFDENVFKYANQAIDYFKDFYKVSEEELLSFALENSSYMEDAYRKAVQSVGFEFEITHSFKDYLSLIKNYSY